MNRITIERDFAHHLRRRGDGTQELREIVPRYKKLGSILAKFVPAPKFRTWHYSPWRKLDEIRTTFDRIVFRMIERAEADPGLGERTDISGVVVAQQACRRNRMSRQDICDELVTLIGAGHETTASALSWAFERLRRHPDVLAELVREVDEGGGDFRRATILEVLRVRPIIDLSWQTGQRVAFRSRRVADSPQSQRVREPCRSAREPAHLPSPRTFRSEPLPGRQALHPDGWRSEAEHAGASALISRSPRWISCCGQYCRISGSRPIPPPTRSRISGESPMPRNTAAA